MPYLRKIVIPLAAAALLGLQGCGYNSGSDKVLVRRNGNQQEEAAQPWAKKFHQYAALAALAYGNIDGLPAPEGWTKSPDQLDDPQTGLYVEVWDRASGPAPEVAIVFRGTNPRELKDWWSNARWLTRFIPTGWDQYDAVRARIAGFVDRARTRVPGAAIVTVGHSLGGGLAQQAAYAHPEIKRVYAFDPSPVTGFRSVPEPARSANSRGIHISRVYEKGEILAYLRGPLRKLLPLNAQDPEIVEVRFNLTRGLSVKEHSMIDLAKQIAQAAR